MKARTMRMVVLGGLVAAAALVACGDSSGGGADGDTQVADGADAVQSDVVVPGPGECELNWVSGFSPFIGVAHDNWDLLDPSEPGTVRFQYDFVGGPGTTVRIDVQSCAVVDGAFQFSATSEALGDVYTLVIEAPNYPGLGTWQPVTADGLTVRLEARAVHDPSVTYLSESSASTQCEICVDATGRQGAFRCDGLLAESGDRGGIGYAGFICPGAEPGFSP